MKARFMGHLQVRKSWDLYSEIVHNTLFFEIIQQQLPYGLVLLLSYTEKLEKLVEEHGNLVALALAVTVSLGKHLISKNSAKLKRRGDRKPRDSKGRFIRIKPKE